MLSTTGRSRQDDERGSLIIVLAIILVAGLLGSVITERAVGAALVSRGHQDSAAAVSAADAGLADALYRIDQGSSGTGSAAAFCVEAGDSHCLASSVPAAPGVSYLASQVSSTDWLVTSQATIDGQRAVVEGHVTQDLEYPFALFGASSLGLNSTATQTFSSYNPSLPASSVSGAQNPSASGTVSVGSNGSITCSGSLGSNVSVTYYGNGGVSSTGTSNCGSYQSYPNRYFVSTPTAPTGAYPCPGVGSLGAELGTLLGGSSTLAPGTYLCTSPITISGVLNVSGPVQLYVIPDASYGTNVPAITITPGSYVNDQSDYCANGGTGGCSPSPDLPSSQNLEIFTGSSAAIGTSTVGSGFYIGAILDAPNASLSGDACNSHYYGAVLIGSLSCSNPQVSVSYDQTLSTLYGSWTAGSYTEVNPSVFTAAMSASGL